MFVFSPRLARLVAMGRKRLSRYETNNSYFYPERSPAQQGDLLKNLPFANTLSLIASRGVRPFYEGEICRDIVVAVSSVKDNSGLLNMEDLRGYEIRERAPV